MPLSVQEEETSIRGEDGRVSCPIWREAMLAVARYSAALSLRPVEDGQQAQRAGMTWASSTAKVTSQ